MSMPRTGWDQAVAAMRPNPDDFEHRCDVCGYFEHACICEQLFTDCPQCEGPPLLLGELGFVFHLQCRNCGWGWSFDTRTDVQE